MLKDAACAKEYIHLHAIISQKEKDGRVDLSSFKVNDTAMISCPTRQVEKWKSQVYIHNNDADAT